MEARVLAGLVTVVNNLSIAAARAERENDLRPVVAALLWGEAELWSLPKGGELNTFIADWTACRKIVERLADKLEGSSSSVLLIGSPGATASARDGGGEA